MKNSRNIFKSLAVVSAVFVIAATMSSCEKDENTKPVPDPAGTITVNISENTRIDFNGNYIYWCKPDNFYILAERYTIEDGWGYRDRISICNIGKVNGLGNTKFTPQNLNGGFTTYASENSSVACEVGHGYMVEILPRGAAPIHARLYVVESIVSTSGGIMGAKIKYQYPYVLE